MIDGLEYAKEIGATTGALSCNKAEKIFSYAEHAVEIVTGSEILTGSIRFKARTAQKLVVDMISIASLIRQGNIYQNLMVDVQPMKN